MDIRFLCGKIVEKCIFRTTELSNFIGSCPLLYLHLLKLSHSIHVTSKPLPCDISNNSSPYTFQRPETWSLQATVDLTLKCIRIEVHGIPKPKKKKHETSSTLYIYFFLSTVSYKACDNKFEDFNILYS